MADVDHSPDKTPRGLLVPTDSIDQLNELTYFVECAWMAALDLTTEQTNAIQAVLNHALRGMKKLSEDMAGDPADEDEEGESL